MIVDNILKWCEVGNRKAWFDAHPQTDDDVMISHAVLNNDAARWHAEHGDDVKAATALQLHDPATWRNLHTCEVTHALLAFRPGGRAGELP